MMSHDQLPSSPNPDEVGRYHIPHSGVHHNERPHREFDNTSLQEAHDRRLITTPDSPKSLKERKNWKKPVGIVAGLGLTAGAAIGIPQYMDHRSLVSGSEEADKIFEELDASFPYQEIPASVVPEVGISAELFSTPQDVVDEFYSQETAWINFAYTDEQRAAENWGKTNIIDKNAEIMGPIDEAYTDALYTGIDPEISELVRASMSIHAETIDRQEATDMDDEVYFVDHEPLTTEIYNETSESFTANVDWINDANIENNEAEGFMPEDEDGATWNSTLNFVLVDGEWKVESGYRVQTS